MKPNRASRLFFLVLATGFLSETAWAYAGFGPLLPFLGALLSGVIGFLILGFGLLWYPVTLLKKKRRERKAAESKPENSLTAEVNKAS